MSLNKFFLWIQLKKISFFIFYSVVLISFAGCGPLFYQPKKHFAKNKLNGPYDAIIVPGFQYNEGEPWHAVVKIRMAWAKYLYDHGHAKNIIFSGAAVYTPFVEAKIMAMYAEKMGIPREHIFTEVKAEHSVENVYNSYRMGKDMGFKKLAVATDFVQAKKLERFIRKFDLPVSMLPIVVDTMKVLNKDEPQIDPSLGKVSSFVPLQDRQGLRKRLRGTMGRKINWHREDLKTERLRKKYSNNIID